MLHNTMRLALTCTLLVAACGDSDAPDVQATPFAVPDADPSEDAAAEAGDSGDESDTGDEPPADMPEPDSEDEPDGTDTGETGADDDPAAPDPEPDYMTSAVDITHTIDKRRAEFVAIDDQGRRLGYLRLHYDEKGRLWVESMYDDGVAWVGLALELYTYVITGHRSTLDVPVLERRAQIFADILSAGPNGVARQCGLQVSLTMATCAEAAGSGESPRVECPTAIHRAACACFEVYDDEFVCA